MKVFLVAAAIVITTAFVAIYVTDAIKASVDIAVNEQVKEDVAEFTYDALDKAQKSTDKAFNKLKKTIKENK